MRLLSMSATLTHAASEARRPAAYRRGQRGTGLEARHRLQEAHHLVGPQHHGQFARRAGIRDPLRQVCLLERYAIEEPKGADGLVQRRAKICRQRPNEPGRCAHLQGQAAPVSGQRSGRI